MEKDHLALLLEDINGKFDAVLEGHSALLRRMDRLAEESKERDDHPLFRNQTLNTKIDTAERTLGAKIGAVAADLAAHRRDPEALGGGVYRVKTG